LIENLLEEAEDSPDDPLNAVIEMLSRAIEAYENQDDELAAFVTFHRDLYICSYVM